MTINEYQELALRTANIREKTSMIINGALGLAGESGEVADLVKKWQYQGHSLSRTEIIDELGDVCWYIALIASALDTSLEEVLIGNIDKLKARYPEGFEVEKSLNRGE